MVTFPTINGARMIAREMMLADTAITAVELVVTLPHQHAPGWINAHVWVDRNGTVWDHDPDACKEGWHGHA